MERADNYMAQYISNSGTGSVLNARTNFHGTNNEKYSRAGTDWLLLRPSIFYDFCPKCCRNLMTGLGLVHLTIWVSFADEAASCLSCEIISCRIKSQTLPVHTYLGSPCRSLKLLLTGYLPPPTHHNGANSWQIGSSDVEALRSAHRSSFSKPISCWNYSCL